MRINVERPDKKTLESMGIKEWPIWTKEPSRFDWSYDQKEVCYILEGRAKVTPDGGSPAEFGPGDLVTFPEGMQCVWDISEKIKKHYRFGS
ncbi:MAG: cupin domain-containing protein [Candidatus Omnitrophica bacterium]|nr:cupin domain-containing protein [Candidatus Omnitrophota bacterium]MDD5487961.1 cupin domain-containing protein [Candidatus Omnitrophota bacterium]